MAYKAFLTPSVEQLRRQLNIKDYSENLRLEKVSSLSTWAIFWHSMVFPYLWSAGCVPEAGVKGIAITPIKDPQ